jgi:hypothetical protein
MDIDKQLKQIVETIIAEVNTNVQTQMEGLVRDQVADLVKKIPIQQIFERILSNGLATQSFEFPEGSIPATAIQSGNLVLSGSQIDSGIITNFGSSGIDDRASSCQLTIMDDVTVVENNLLTKDLTVKGTTTIEGDLNVTGTMPESSPLFQNVVRAATNNVRSSLNDSVFESYADLVTTQIKKTGLDLNKITIDGKEIINGANLGSFITSSSLQRVGTLQELQVQGETLLGQTLYVSARRVGVNTIEPGQALSIWDQEVEIGAGKQSNNTGIIGTPRNQTLIVGANGKNNLVLTPDGATTVNQLNIGTMSFSVADMPPSDNQSKGSVVFNSNPSVGGPLGWISLGNAQWANFGIID